MPVQRIIILDTDYNLGFSASFKKGAGLS